MANWVKFDMEYFVILIEVMLESNRQEFAKLSSSYSRRRD